MPIVCKSQNLRTCQGLAGIALPFCEGDLKPGFSELIRLISEYGDLNKQTTN
jgi:hypothetical protein